MTFPRLSLPELLAVPESVRLARIQDRLAGARARGLGGTILFGCGFLGRHVARVLHACQAPPQAFADNNPALWGTIVEGIPVLPPVEAAERFRESAVFVVTVFTCGPVVRQLAELGLTAFTFPEWSWCAPDAFLPFSSLSRPAALQAMAGRIMEARDIWADEASCREFDAQIAWRTSLDGSVLPPGLPHDDIYFPADLVRVGPDDVFVDCGAFDGDTLREVLRRVPGGVRHFYGIEPDPGNAEALRATIGEQGETVARACTVLPCALGSREDTLRFAATGTAASRVDARGTVEIPVRRLDDLFAGTAPTYIKMDVEGAEGAALEGAVDLLRRHRPVLAICLYHRVEDLWELPLRIRQWEPSYRLFLRRYCDDCWEQVCYAVPPERLA